VAQQQESRDIGHLIGKYKHSALKRLKRRGKVQTEGGAFASGKSSIAFASDAGCKTFNNDFVASWQPADTKEVLWAAAIADGVTGCLLASEASELAALCGLAAIAAATDSAASRNPIAFTTRVFHQIGRQVANAPNGLCPSDCSASAWEFATRKGKFLQTTLNLVWATHDGLRIMAIGDGDCFIRRLSNLLCLQLTTSAMASSAASDRDPLRFNQRRIGCHTVAASPASPTDWPTQLTSFQCFQRCCLTRDMPLNPFLRI
jgi:hypothetical protein